MTQHLHLSSRNTTVHQTEDLKKIFIQRLRFDLSNNITGQKSKKNSFYSLCPFYKHLEYTHISMHKKIDERIFVHLAGLEGNHFND